MRAPPSSARELSSAYVWRYPSRTSCASATMVRQVCAETKEATPLAVGQRCAEMSPERLGRKRAFTVPAWTSSPFDHARQRSRRDALVLRAPRVQQNAGSAPAGVELLDHPARQRAAALLRRPSKSSRSRRLSSCYLYTGDADALYAEWDAIGVVADPKTGSRLTGPPVATDYGMREFALSRPEREPDPGRLPAVRLRCMIKQCLCRRFILGAPRKPELWTVESVRSSCREGARRRPSFPCRRSCVRPSADARFRRGRRGRWTTAGSDSPAGDCARRGCEQPRWQTLPGRRGRVPRCEALRAVSASGGDDAAGDHQGAHSSGGDQCRHPRGWRRHPRRGDPAVESLQSAGFSSGRQCARCHPTKRIDSWNGCCPRLTSSRGAPVHSLVAAPARVRTGSPSTGVRHVTQSSSATGSASASGTARPRPSFTAPSRQPAA